MFIAPTQSALAEKPHSKHSNLVCVLRFSAAVCPHRGHLRLVFWGGTGTRRPPFHCVLYASWRRNSNGLASRIERLSRVFGPTLFPGFAFVPRAEADIFFTGRFATNTPAWCVLLWFDALGTSSVLVWE